MCSISQDVVVSQSYDIKAVDPDLPNISTHEQRGSVGYPCVS